MQCPECGCKTKVLETRYLCEVQHKKRRRVCKACGNRFWTVEKVLTGDAKDMPSLCKHDGRREPFMEQKLRRSLRLALVKRSVKDETVDALVDKIKERMIAADSIEITSKELGMIVMSELKRIDKVAYIRFASVYHDFKDMGAFRSEIDQVADAETSLSKWHQLSWFED